MNKVLRVVFAAICFLLVASCAESPAVQSVKNGHLTDYPHKSIGSAIDGFFANPRWSSGTGTDGQTTLVNVRGDILYHEKRVTAELQFVLDDETGSFRINALEFNGIPQNRLMITTLIERAFED